MWGRVGCQGPQSWVAQGTSFLPPGLEETEHAPLRGQSATFLLLPGRTAEQKVLSQTQPFGENTLEKY